MKNLMRIFAVGLIAGLSFLPVARAADALSNGSAAPQWSTTDLDGKTVTLSDLKGKVVVVDFWATWCGPCVSEIPGYVGLQKKYGEKGLVIVGLSRDEGGIEVVRKFAAAHHLNYKVGLASDEVVTAYGSSPSIPTTFVIDRSGIIRFQKVGAMPTADFEAQLKPLL